MTRRGSWGCRSKQRYRVTDHYLKDLIELIRRESYDFVLLGGGPEFINDYVAPRRSSLLLADELNRIRRQIRKKMYFPGESTRDKARRLFANVSCSVGVFVNRNFRGADRIGVLMLDERDRAMLDEIDAILGGVKVTLRVADAGFAAQLQREVRHLDGRPGPGGQSAFGSVQRVYSRQQMLIVSYNSWLHITRQPFRADSVVPVVYGGQACAGTSARTKAGRLSGPCGRPGRMRSRSTVPSSPYRLTRVSVRQRT